MNIPQQTIPIEIIVESEPQSVWVPIVVALITIVGGAIVKEIIRKRKSNGN